MRLSQKHVDGIARRQYGVLSVRQLQAAGADRSWIGRQVASGRWQRTLPGVVLTHGGPVPWHARAWSAVLYAGIGSALSHGAAARALHVSTRQPDIIDLTIPWERRVRAQPGLRIHRRVDMPKVTGGLPTVNRHDTAVDLVSTATSVDEAISCLCDAIRAGAWPDLVLEAADRRSRLRNKELLVELVQLTETGVESALELRYGRDVEARHGLPPSLLQQRSRLSTGWIRADRVYAGLGVRVELDGWLGHPGGRTDADTWRDNEVLVQYGDITLRFRWRHVAVDPCQCALQLARALRSRGWTGHPVACSPTCAIRRGSGTD